MTRIAELNPPTNEFDNWGTPKVYLDPIYGRKSHLNVDSKDMETNEKIKVNVPIWENFEAKISWGGTNATIVRQGSLFKVDFGDDDPLYADDSLSAWKFYKSTIMDRSTAVEDKKDFKNKRKGK